MPSCSRPRGRSRLSGFSHLPPPEGRDHSLGRSRAAADGPNLADIRHFWGTASIGLEKHHCRAYQLRGDAGIEELDYATCEASFETKSGDEGRADVGCRRSVSVPSGGRIRNDQRAGRGYADDEEYYARARDHPR
jgi:hypothetical protein